MASRLPPSVQPDHLTAVGLGGAVISGVAYGLGGGSVISSIVAVVGLTVNWWADSLDGTLARVRQAERVRYGFFLDHQTDILSVGAILGGLAMSPLMRGDIAVGLWLAYYLLFGLTMSLAVVSREFHVSFGIFGPTEARIALGVLSLITAIVENTWSVWGGRVTVLDIAAATSVTLMVSTYATTVWKTLRRLGVEDPARRP